MEESRNLPKLSTQTAITDFPDFKVFPFQALYFNCMVFITVMYLLLLIFGLTANILNIVVYAKTSVRDNITVSFLWLSTSDLLYLVLLSPHLIAISLIHLIQLRLGISIKWLLDPQILIFPFYWYASVFYETSILINVYISVVRCACVAMPFKVKSIFTAHRAVMAFVVFFVSIFLLRIPMFMKKRIILAFDPVSNATRVVYKEVEDGGLAEKMNDIISGNILNWASFVIVITCLVVMVTKLQASARFRLSNALPDPPSQPTVVNNDDIHRAQTCISEQTDISPSDMNLPDNQSSVFNNHCHHQSQAKEKTKNDAKTQPLEEESCPKTIQFKAVKKKSLASDRGQHNVVTPRETQVVRSVILVAIIFVTCQTPLMVTTLARRFESQFDDEDDMAGGKVQKYVYLFGLCANISQVFILINASVNIIVYYNFNTRYRQCIRRLWK